MGHVLRAWLWATALLLAAPAAAQTLAPGEILFEAVAVGSARADADTATLLVSVIATGTNEAGANQALPEAIERATAAARSVGVAEQDIDTTSLALFDVADEPPPFETEDDVGEARRWVARRSINIVVRDRTRIQAVRQALEQAGAEAVGYPTFALTDETAARGAAREEALRSARAQAEAYAAALGMRVDRVVRVSERLGMEVVSLALSEPDLQQRFAAARTGSEPQVELFAIVGVDFALAPR